VGCNPRHEATILNARIRKAFRNNKTPIFSIGNLGDQTYDYKIIGDNSQTIKDIVEEKHEFNKVLSEARKPLIIIGESALELDSGGYIFEELKNFLYQKKLINEKWNALNILIQNASTVGALDLKILNNKQNNFDFFDNITNNRFKVLYLLNSDNLKFVKKDEFVIYQGSHGDRGAEIADVILPSAAYTEENGLFQNLEGRVQECRKASYPAGDALESWKVLNKLTNVYKNKNLFDSFNTLRKEVLTKLVNFESINKLPNYKKPSKKINNSFKSEKVFINPIDYYFSNSISRASKVMSECRDIKLKHLKSGTNN
ncbi:molybdopterin-dependent oxidoreductase, partial [Pelagibacteraceae bacterium]|nr:molybdopterin-dependent oxidoreductase [Pelagibacteraceae bacterium]